ncbi:MAG: IclR family transcriptional regulator [Proteobacteria bacterium]|nr:IclR family transcriptional regulator [Pseudomonadota bacterium]
MPAKKKPIPQDPAEAAPKERGGIQSLERAFAILEEVARNVEGINVADLSKAVGLHNSTTFHLVKTMAQLGYISQVRESKRYRIGTKLFTLAAGALEENSFLAVATPVLEKLTGETGESAHFAIRSGNSIVVIARTAGSGLLQMVDRNGGQRPAHATALGKVLLSPLNDAQIRQFLGPEALRKFTPKTISERDTLLREIAEVRRTGIAYDDGEFDEEIRCVAVPVFDFAGRVAGAVGISGAVWRLSLQSLQAKAEQVREAARSISAQLGYSEAKAPRVA